MSGTWRWFACTSDSGLSGLLKTRDVILYRMANDRIAKPADYAKIMCRLQDSDTDVAQDSDFQSLFEGFFVPNKDTLGRFHSYSDRYYHLMHIIEARPNRLASTAL